MRVGLFIIYFLFVIFQVEADTLKVSATYSVPIKKLQVNEPENPTYSTSVELEEGVCELESPEYIRYLLPSFLVGRSLPVLLKKTSTEGSRHYYTGKNVSEAKCMFSAKGNSRAGICIILYYNLNVNLNMTIEMTQKEFSVEGPESLSRRLRASKLFASSEPAGFLRFQYDCSSAQVDKAVHGDISK